MAVETAGTTEEATAVQMRPRLFTTDEYERLVGAGILSCGERVELIEGQIVEMNPIGPEHVWSVNDLNDAFRRIDDVVVSVQNPIRLREHVEPQPDIVVLRTRGPRNRVPLAEHALLVVEVADTSLAHDRYTKAPLYGRAGIPEYWIVDLNGERIEVYREPSPAGYRTVRFFLRGESLTPSFAPDMVIQVDAILGPALTPDE